MRRVASIALFALAAGSAYAQDAPPREVFATAQEFLVRDGGRWVSPNRHHRPGQDSPRWFGLEFSWAARPHAVLGRIYGIAEAGSLSQLWVMLTVWDPGRREAVHHQMSAGGMWVHGPLRLDGADDHSVEMAGAGLDGMPVRFRDRLRTTGPDTMETQTALFRAGAWHEQPRERWLRVPSFDPESWPELPPTASGESP